MRELGLSQSALARWCGWLPPAVSAARAGRVPLGPRRVAALSAMTGIDFARPRYFLRCGLWLREGALSAEDRARVREAVSARVRELYYHLGTTVRIPGDCVARREPSYPCGPASSYIPPGYRRRLGLARPLVAAFDEEVAA